MRATDRWVAAATRLSLVCAWIAGGAGCGAARPVTEADERAADERAEEASAEEAAAEEAVADIDRPEPTAEVEVGDEVSDATDGDDEMWCDYAYYVAQLERIRAAPSELTDPDGTFDPSSFSDSIDRVEVRSMELVDSELLEQIRAACGVPIAPEQRVSRLMAEASRIHDRLMALLDDESDAAPRLSAELRREVQQLLSASDAAFAQALRDRAAVLEAVTDDPCARRRILEAQRWRDSAHSMQEDARYLRDDGGSLEQASLLDLAAYEAWSLGSTILHEPSDATAQLRRSRGLRSTYGVTWEPTRARVAELVGDCPDEIDPDVSLPSFLDMSH